MNSTERKGTFSIAGIYMMRMMGLFMIMPVFALYAENLDGVTPMLIGVALGIYGLTMAALQIPFGWLSDRFGRKKIITIGLILFAIGSVVAAMADSIWGVIFGRALQGSGAIAAAMMALLADLTHEDNRLKAMGTVGVSIGFSFTLAMVLGPLLNRYIGVDGIFWVTAGMALVSMFILHVLVPKPEHSHRHRDVEANPASFRQVLSNGQLLRLDAGILIQHAIMTAMFIALPHMLRDHLHLPTESHPWLYLPVMLLSFVVMVPLIIIAEKKKKMKGVFLLAVGLMIGSEVMLGVLHDSLWTVGLGLLIFFIAFNVLEASLPSLISRMAPVDARGTAMGVYSTSQFFGAFVGGVLGGMAYHAWGASGLFLACAAVAALWWLIALGMEASVDLSSMLTHVDSIDAAAATELTGRLLALPGVAEARVVPEETAVFMKVNKQLLDQQALQSLLAEYRA